MNNNRQIIAILSSIAVLSLAFLLATSPFFIGGNQSSLADAGASLRDFGKTPEEDQEYFDELSDETQEATELDDRNLLPEPEQQDIEKGFVLKIPQGSEVTEPAPVKQPEAPAEAKKTPINLNAMKTEKPVVRSQPKPKYISQTAYWVQVASFSDATRAKAAKEDLAGRGIPSYIETVSVPQGKIMYRLRAGAWSSEKEALKFRSMIQSVKSYETAYITQSVMKKKID